MKQYKHLFFDLDKTIWDVESNSNAALLDIYNKYNLQTNIETCDDFSRTYHEVNDALWIDYKKGRMNKKTLRKKRFFITLKKYDIVNENFSKKLDLEYISIRSAKTNLLPFAHETLSYLSEKYSLYIISNGTSENQTKKLQNCDLNKYFQKIYTSDKIGYQKPHVEFFKYALNTVNAKKEESMVIGDNLKKDILGAKRYGVDQIWLNPSGVETTETPTFKIKSLKELMDLL